MNPRRLLTASVMLGFCVAACSASAQPDGVPVPKTQLADLANNFKQADVLSAKDTALQRLVELADRGAATMLGFPTKPKLSELQALDPIPETMVDLSKLKVFVHTQNPKGLLVDQQRWTFPVVKDEKVVSSITIGRIGGAWKPAEFGSTALIRALMKARFAAPDLRKNGAAILLPGAQANYRLVKVPGLNLQFLGADGPFGLLLMPLFDNPRFNFKTGALLPANAVFVGLSRPAKLLNGEPT